MKNIFILLALCFSLLTSTSCQKDAWEEVELGKTPVLFLLNTTEKSSDEVYGFSVYYELNSLILWQTQYITSSGEEIEEYSDSSTDEDYHINFKIIAETIEKVETENEGTINEIEKKVVYVRTYVLKATKATGIGTLTVYERKQVDSEETGDSTLIEEYEVSVSKQEKYKTK